MKKIHLLTFFLLFFAFISSNAQDKRRTWAVGVGTNIVDIVPYTLASPVQTAKDFGGLNDWNLIPIFSRVYMANYLGAGFTVDAAGAINIIKETPYDDNTDRSYFSADLGVRYSLSQMFKRTRENPKNIFDPYVKLSTGIFSLNDDLGAVVSPGAGFNIWFNDGFGINIESAYKTSSPFGDSKWGKVEAIESKYHFQHAISIVFRFGAKDSDKDGILDIEDECPDIAGQLNLFGCPDSDEDGIADIKDKCPNILGVKDLEGCPDSDGDGITDELDQCPNQPGKSENNGCPDSDGDGVIDSLDSCPNAAGNLADNGCPDSDKDGLLDHKDKCPKIVGVLQNGGCPWPDTDGDEVIDKEDKCINKRGPVSNGGCPVVLSVAAKKKLGQYAKTIQFNSGTATFKEGTATSLDIIVDVMKEFDGVKFDIEGHTDDVGNDDVNLKLSQDRAQAVVDYMVKQGVPDWRLQAKGYGETKPIASNKTAAGKALNRRVVLNAVDAN